MKSLGWLNDGGETERCINEARAECERRREAGEVHDLIGSDDYQHCVHVYGCRTCGFVYSVDSGD